MKRIAKGTVDESVKMEDLLGMEACELDDILREQTRNVIAELLADAREELKRTQDESATYPTVHSEVDVIHATFLVMELHSRLHQLAKEPRKRRRRAG